ncbi:MAG: hypothetical protein Kow00128_18740 [Deltaproteobacteria bacterium]
MVGFPGRGEGRDGQEKEERNPYPSMRHHGVYPPGEFFSIIGGEQRTCKEREIDTWPIRS